MKLKGFRRHVAVRADDAWCVVRKGVIVANHFRTQREARAAAVALNKDPAEGLRQDAERLIGDHIRPDMYDARTSAIASEIARRIAENARLLAKSRRTAELFDQVLIVLHDYRDHEWAPAVLRREDSRISLARKILELQHP